MSKHWDTMNKLPVNHLSKLFQFCNSLLKLLNCFSLTLQNAAVFFVMSLMELVTVHPTQLVPTVNFVCKGRVAMTRSLGVRTVAVRDLV